MAYLRTSLAGLRSCLKWYSTEWGRLHKSSHDLANQEHERKRRLDNHWEVFLDIMTTGQEKRQWCPTLVGRDNWQVAGRIPGIGTRAIWSLAHFLRPGHVEIVERSVHVYENNSRTTAACISVKCIHSPITPNKINVHHFNLDVVHIHIQ